MKKYVKILFLFLCGCIIFEISCRLALTGDFLVNFVDKRTEWHHLHRIRWIKRQEEGREGQIYYSFDEYHPIYGWTLKKNIHSMAVFHEKILNSNSIGCRGTQEYDVLKKKDILRIAVVGDSFSFGEEVGDHETFSYFLQKMIPRSEVMNFAVHGYGHDQILLRLRDEVLKYRPDIVILGYIDSDDYRNLVTFRDYAKPRFVEQNGNLKLINVPVPTPQELIDNEIYRLKSWDLLVTLYNIAIDQGRYKREEKYRNLLITEMFRETDKIGAHFVVVHLPYTYNRFDGDASPSERDVLSLCAQIDKIVCFGTREEFRAFKHNGHVFNDGEFFHWGAQSHYVVAVKIVKELTKRKLLRRLPTKMDNVKFPQTRVSEIF